MGRTKKVIDEEEVPKKRSKKQFAVVAKVSADGIMGTLMTHEIKPLIAHLPIHSSEVKFYDGPPQYNPAPPNEAEPYDESLLGMEINNEQLPTDQSHFSFIDSAPPPPIILPYEERELPVLEQEVVHVPVEEVVQPVKKNDIGGKILMTEFAKMNEERRLPDKTDIACMWCTYEFNDRPAVIPRSEEGGVWYVYGNFCCPECAMASLLDEKEDMHKHWEKIALLHRLYGDYNGRIYPAPSRAVLARFGGMYSIDQYRDLIAKRQLRIDINYPPMISLIGTIDTKPIDFYEPTAKFSDVTLNNDMVSRAQEGLRLKRTKPLKERESTLDACMNLTVKAR